MDWYARAIQTQAPWSFLLLFGQVLLVAMLVERSVFLLIKTQVNVTMFLQQIEKLAKAGNIDRAIRLTKALTAPAGRVCRVGLEGLGKGPFFLTEELDRAIAAEVPAIYRRIGRIPLVALGVAALGLVASALGGAGTLNASGAGPLPFGLDERYALALVGVPSGIIGLLWSVGLATKAKQVVADLGRCKAVVLALDSGSNVEAAQQRPPAAG